MKTTGWRCGNSGWRVETYVGGIGFGRKKGWWGRGGKCVWMNLCRWKVWEVCVVTRGRCPCEIEGSTAIDVCSYVIDHIFFVFSFG